MSKFKRVLPDNFFKELKNRYWGEQLLNLWAASGEQNSSGPNLRLAIRNNYVNFYYKGQSVALVKMLYGKTPVLETHVKYLGKSTDKQEYARITNEDNFFFSKSFGRIDYPDRDQVIKKICENIAGKGQRKDFFSEEKIFVDDLISCSKHVVDLEIALPGDILNMEGKKIAPRIDLACIANENGEVKIVFWEAKMFRDSRLLEQKGVDKNGNEKKDVFKQIQQYSKYLKKNFEYMQNGYASLCKELLMAYNVAGKTAPDHLSQIAKDPKCLTIDPVTRLVIGKPQDDEMNQTQKNAWKARLALLDKNNIYNHQIFSVVYKSSNPDLKDGTIINREQNVL